MGILNVTPDSFSDGGRFMEADAALRRAEKLIQEGADIVDIGGESTAPGKKPVPANEEVERVAPVVRALARTGALVSIDSYKPSVVRACLEVGASMINDVTGAENPEMGRLAREFGVPLVVMHMQGRPRDMQTSPQYDDVISEIKDFFRARTAGLKDVQTILDPGLGFGKTVAHNLAILRGLEAFREFGLPLLLGASRKHFIGSLTGGEPTDRLAGTIASHTIAIMNGADIIRVHDVEQAKRAAQVADAVRRASE
jgi:dihydropteroate synthase